MKKLLSVILTLTMLFTVVCAVSGEGEDVKVLLDGQEIAFDVPPQIVEERTLVPFRAIFEALGYDVDWYGETQTISATTKDVIITMWVGNGSAIYNNMSIVATSVDLDVPPMIIGERTMVPVRAVAELSKCDVQWDSDSRSVLITSRNSAASEETAEPTVTEAPPLKYTIEYDYMREQQEHFMKNFRFESIDKDASGNYVVAYTLNTFMEGRGSVNVTFNCLDADGNIVDSWSRSYPSVDYTYTPQSDTVTISGQTTKIELVIE
ncbi:MAG: copper amine oxidase N-terminal domain-containing protein [Oscillospiraceae bacterium]|nr:copper amine oxidase N-terminal domain-containing protein [Oscillospiraceae bacterium]